MKQTTREELANSLSHGIGAVLSLVMLAAIGYYTLYSLMDDRHLLAFWIYGVSLFLMYLSSTLYHSFFLLPAAQRFFKIWDHAAIYLSIAGGYTPFLLIPLGGAFGDRLAAVIWGIAAVGIIATVCLPLRFRILSTLCYLALGWSCLFFIQPLIAAIPEGAFWWLLAGGLAYTVGAVFYICKAIPFNHFIWHIFVLIGSAAQFVSIFGYLRFLPVGV